MASNGKQPDKLADDMKGTVAIISGGLGDIGSAVVARLGKEGAKVAIGDLAGEELASSRLASFRAQGCCDLHYTRVDVCDESQVAAWLDNVEKKWGTPQIVIPNAGIVVRGAFTDAALSTAEVRRQFEVNFWGSYHMAVEAAKRMKRSALPGRITFIGSWVADRPLARISAYCVSKAAVRMLSKTLALDLAADNILVNEVAPGIVEGGLSKENQQRDPNLRQAHLAAAPVHRLIAPEEIAVQVVNLSSLSNVNVTGTTIVMDGGLSLTSKLSS